MVTITMGAAAFIYGDLIVLPLIIAYSKYYGRKPAAYITLVLYTAMIVAGILVDLLFAASGLIPEQRGNPAMSEAEFSWNYTTWLNIVAILGGAWLIWLHWKGGEESENKAHDPEAVEGGHAQD